MSSFDDFRVAVHRIPAFIGVTEPHLQPSWARCLLQTRSASRAELLLTERTRKAALTVQAAAEGYFNRPGLRTTIEPGVPTEMVFVFQIPTDASGLIVERSPL